MAAVSGPANGHVAGTTLVAGPAGVLFQPRPSRSGVEATGMNGAGNAALTAASRRLRWPAMVA
jgi:hypothetical protein